MVEIMGDYRQLVFQRFLTVYFYSDFFCCNILDMNFFWELRDTGSFFLHEPLHNIWVLIDKDRVFKGIFYLSVLLISVYGLLNIFRQGK